MSNISRVQDGFLIILPVMKKFVKTKLRATYGDNWLNILSQRGIEIHREGNYQINVNNPEEVFDSADLNSTVFMLTSGSMWNNDFRKCGISKAYIQELRDVRNKVSHTDGEDLSDDDTFRALDTMARVCDSMQPEESEKIREILRKVRYDSNGDSQLPQSKNAIKEQTKREREALLVKQMPELPAWRRVIEPNADVAAGRYKNADFAANLADVAAGNAPQEYLDPVDFFHRTYVTHGIKKLLIQAIRRITGGSGDPVIQLKTSFGGGKTHTMLALYHLMRKMVPVPKMRGMNDILEEAGVDDIPKVKVAVIVGTALDPSKSKTPANMPGIKINTLWGEIGAQLSLAAGDFSLYDKYIKEADKKSVSPGYQALRDLFDACGPCMVLIDELVAYARKIYGKDNDKLPAGTFDNLMTFIQELTEAATASKNSLVVASIPESDEEIGGESGRKTLKTIEKFFGRIESVWNPVEANESFEIVRRRLFKSCDDENQIDLFCKCFAKWYNDNPSEFPQEVRENDYIKKLKGCYPIHPTIFDYLYNVWAQIENFQRTRGVLRFMAGVVHYLWQIGDESPVIMPWAIPFCDSDVSGELIKYLSESQVWSPIINTQVDGKNSIPNKLDAKDTRFGQICASRRIMRAIMFTTAPSRRAQNVRGISQLDIHLCVMMPNEKSSTYDDALSKLEDNLSNLYSSPDHSHFWLDTRPTLRKEMRDRMEKCDNAEVQKRVSLLLGNKIGKSTLCENIHICPQSTADIPDDSRSIRLVVLSLNQNYSSHDSAHLLAQNTALDYLTHKGDKARLYKNTLLFLAPDNDGKQMLEKCVKEMLAWESIRKDANVLNLGTVEVKEVANNCDASEKAVKRQIEETYCWLMVPTQETEANSPIEWNIESIRGSETMNKNIDRCLRESESVIEEWSPRFLLNQLNQFYFKEDKTYLDVKTLWQHLMSYCYMPRLAHHQVLQKSIRKCVKDEMCGYASNVTISDASDIPEKFNGLQTKTDILNVDFAGGIIVKQSAVEAQCKAERLKQENEVRAIDSTSGADTSGDLEANSSGHAHGDQSSSADFTAQPAKREPVMHRFYTCKHIDVANFTKEMKADFIRQISEEILANLIRDTNHIDIRFEIDASSSRGFSKETVRAVDENATVIGLDGAFEE